MDNVRDYYDRLAPAEWERLVKDPYHELEFRATLACLEEHLPAEGVVLDAGGGPGRYALELCRRGYSVTLLDLAERCIELARANFSSEPTAVQARLRAAEIGDLRDLSRFADHSFDAALCLGGAFSHVPVGADQQRTLSELARVGKPGAPIVISVIGYYALLCTILTRFPEDLGRPEKQCLLHGDNVCTGGFPDAHFFRPEELRALAEAEGIQTIETRACEGLSSNLADATNALAQRNDGSWERWLSILDETGRDPSVVAVSEHFLYVGRVPFGSHA